MIASRTLPPSDPLVASNDAHCPIFASPTVLQTWASPPAASQRFVDQYSVPVWGTPARLLKTRGFRKGAWALAFLDRADVANALGYHDLTPDGLPLSKVFVQTTLDVKQKVSVTACHELAEMLVDPAINLAAAGAGNVFYAYETADAVEEVE